MIISRDLPIPLHQYTYVDGEVRRTICLLYKRIVLTFFSTHLHFDGDVFYFYIGGIKMKKFYTLLTAMLLALGLLAACGNESTEPIKEEKPVEDSIENKEETAIEAAFPVTIKDAADKDIVIEKKPEKIVSLMPSNTETFCSW